jgi:two-component system chemotaxis sensor kinase CheA
VLEGLKDPLLHLVRNAVDHGIEPPADRAVAGKPESGRITVSASLRGAHVEVVVADDGRGMDLDRIREKAHKKGMSEPQDDRELARLAFLPGFSTAAIVTGVSGRGVGLDVVESRIQSLHGTVDVAFAPGAGARFTLTVPLTLTTIRCVLLTVGAQTYAIPTSNIQHLVRFDPADIRTVGGHQVLLLGGTPTPVCSLAGLLDVAQEHAEQHAKQLAIVVVAGDQKVALHVDEVAAEQEVLVKSLGSRIRRVRFVSGASLLPSGKVALVLNASNVVRAALGREAACAISAQGETTTAARKKRLMMVEDSMTTRALMRSILENAGYDVLTAVDGCQAWDALQHEQVDLVVSDVDMPRMDGFQLTSAVRGSDRMAEMPVILVTARETDEDKERGMRVGANAYLPKTTFDQRNLLETIEQLL